MRPAAGTCVLAILAASCSMPAAEETPVVTTILPLSMIARELGGEPLRARALVPPGASPHTFEPRPGDLAALSGARLFVQVGAGLDDWAKRLVAAAGPELRHLVLIEAPGLDPLPADPSHAHAHGGGMDTHRGHGSPGEHDAPAGAGGGAGGSERAQALDPHVWLDPLRVRDALAPALADALAAMDPDAAQDVARRLREFQARLTALDEEIRKVLADVPLRSYVPFHNAWRYFAQRYDLMELAVVQEFPGEEPTPRELMRLVEAARRAGLPAILIEPQLDPRLAAVLAAEFGGATVLVDPMGDPRDPARAGYEELLRWNALAFRRALSKAAP